MYLSMHNWLLGEEEKTAFKERGLVVCVFERWVRDSEQNCLLNLSDLYVQFLYSNVQIVFMERGFTSRRQESWCSDAADVCKRQASKH